MALNNGVAALMPSGDQRVELRHGHKLVCSVIYTVRKPTVRCLRLHRTAHRGEWYVWVREPALWRGRRASSPPAVQARLHRDSHAYSHLPSHDSFFLPLGKMLHTVLKNVWFLLKNTQLYLYGLRFKSRLVVHDGAFLLVSHRCVKMLSPTQIFTWSHIFINGWVAE